MMAVMVVALPRLESRQEVTDAGTCSDYCITYPGVPGGPDCFESCLYCFNSAGATFNMGSVSDLELHV